MQQADLDWAARIAARLLPHSWRVTMSAHEFDCGRVHEIALLVRLPFRDTYLRQAVVMRYDPRNPPGPGRLQEFALLAVPKLDAWYEHVHEQGGPSFG